MSFFPFRPLKFFRVSFRLLPPSLRRCLELRLQNDDYDVNNNAKKCNAEMEIQAREWLPIAEGRPTEMDGAATERMNETLLWHIWHASLPCLSCLLPLPLSLPFLPFLFPSVSNKEAALPCLPSPPRLSRIAEQFNSLSKRRWLGQAGRQPVGSQSQGGGLCAL